MNSNDPKRDEQAGFLQNLTRQLFRWDCVEPESLNDYVLGYSNQHAQIEMHLQTCVRCRQEVQQFKQFLDQTADPPQASPTAAFLGIPAQQAALGLRGESDLQKVVFRNVLDDVTVELFVGVQARSADYLLNGQFILSAEMESYLERAKVEIWQDGQQAVSYTHLTLPTILLV